MSSVRCLAKGQNYSIDYRIDQDQVMHSIQIAQLSPVKILATVAVDPMDHMVAGSIGPEALKELGDEANEALDALSKVLLENFGAKELIIFPESKEAKMNLPGFIPIQNAEFKRFRHASKADLIAATQKILSVYPALKSILDNRYDFVRDAKTFLQDRPGKQLFAIQQLLSTAGFTQSKMKEYEFEDFQGKYARITSQHVIPIFMVDRNNNNHPIGMVRILKMGNTMGYLSDEVVNQNILPLDKFQGQDAKEQTSNRAMFLLSYLINQASKIAPEDLQHICFIAAAGREAMYDAAGAQLFPITGLRAVMNFGAPKPALQQAKENIKSLQIPGAAFFSARANLARLFAHSTTESPTAQPPAPAAAVSLTSSSS